MTMTFEDFVKKVDKYDRKWYTFRNSCISYPSAVEIYTDLGVLTFDSDGELWFADDETGIEVLIICGLEPKQMWKMFKEFIK